MSLFKKLGKKPGQTAEKAAFMGYKSDGRAPREKIGRGKQRILLDSTKRLLDNTFDDKINPYEAAKRVDDNVSGMFNNGDGTEV